jgi:hypothetical protein
MIGFQATTNQQPAPAVAGDFASANPRASELAGPGALVAAAAGLVVGRFGWLDPTFIIAGNTGGPGMPNGFVGNTHQALITTYLAETSRTIPGGFGVTMYIAGDFWVVNDGTTPATPGQKAYANYADGKATFAATGAPTTTGGTSTASTIAAGTATSVTASIADNVMTVTAVGSGALKVGGQLSGTGVATGTQIVAQLTGTAGSTGTYQVSIPEQTVTSTTVTQTYGLLTVGGTVAGTYAVGDLLTGASAGTYITALGTGTGGAGTYIVNNTQTVGSGVIDSNSNVETNFYCRSFGNPGELVKISSYANG